VLIPVRAAIANPEIGYSRAVLPFVPNADRSIKRLLQDVELPKHLKLYTFFPGRRSALSCLNTAVLIPVRAAIANPETGYSRAVLPFVPNAERYGSAS